MRTREYKRILCESKRSNTVKCAGCVGGIFVAAVQNAADKSANNAQSVTSHTIDNSSMHIYNNHLNCASFRRGIPVDVSELSLSLTRYRLMFYKKIYILLWKYYSTLGSEYTMLEYCENWNFAWFIANFRCIFELRLIMYRIVCLWCNNRRNICDCVKSYGGCELAMGRLGLETTKAGNSSCNDAPR